MNRSSTKRGDSLPRSLPKETMREHVEALAQRYGVQIIEAAAPAAFRAGPRETELWVQARPVRSSMTYVEALHSLGRLVGPEGSSRPQAVVYACCWALSHALASDVRVDKLEPGPVHYGMAPVQPSGALLQNLQPDHILRRLVETGTLPEFVTAIQCWRSDLNESLPVALRDVTEGIAPPDEHAMFAAFEWRSRKVGLARWLGCELARHPDTPQKISERLARDDDPVVRAALAGSQFAEPSILEALAVKDPSEEVRAAAQSNSNLPNHVKAMVALSA